MTAPSPLDDAGSRVAFAVEVQGDAIDSAYQVVSIDTWTAVNKVPRAQVVLFDGSAAERDFPISNEDTFVPGAEVVLKAGHDDADTPIFSGVIVKQSIEITESAGSKLRLDLADPCVGMTLSRKSAVFDDVTDSALIGTLCQQASLTADVSATTTKHEKIVQLYATDWDLMVTRAEANGMVVMVSGGKATVKKPDASQEPALRVVYGESILELSAELDGISPLAGSVQSSAWDYSTQAVVVGEPGQVKVTEAGNLTAEALAQKLSGKLGASSHPQQSGAPLAKEALADWSTAELLRAKLAKIRGHVRFQGSALAEVGKTLQLEGVGERFEGQVFIGGVHHGIRNGRWQTTVTFGLAPRPFAAEAPRIAAPGASGQLPPARGLHTGLVKQVSQDPAGEQRVLVTLPLLKEETGVWARLGSFYASKEVGAVFYPEIGDEVVVGFMDEDPRFPVILASVYSKPRTPPAPPDDQNTKKVIVTREKLSLSFDDKDKIIEVKTPGGHTVTMSDKDGSITIADSNENTVELSKDGVTVNSAKDITLTAKGDVSIHADGNVKVSADQDASMEGLNVTHKATKKLSAEGTASSELTSPAGKVKILGGMVNIN